MQLPLDLITFTVYGTNGIVSLDLITFTVYCSYAVPLLQYTVYCSYTLQCPYYIFSSYTTLNKVTDDDVAIHYCIHKYLSPLEYLLLKVCA